MSSLDWLVLLVSLFLLGSLVCNMFTGFAMFTCFTFTIHDSPASETFVIIFRKNIFPPLRFARFTIFTTFTSSTSFSIFTSFTLGSQMSEFTHIPRPPCCPCSPPPKKMLLYPSYHKFSTTNILPLAGPSSGLFHVAPVPFSIITVSSFQTCYQRPCTNSILCNDIAIPYT